MKKNLGILMFFLSTIILCSCTALKKTSNYQKQQKKSEKYTKLVVAMPFNGVSQEDLQIVTDEINKITNKKLQIEVEFASNASYKNDVNLMLAGNEQLDIMAVGGSMFYENYINGDLLPLNDYLEKYGQGIIDEIGIELIEACSINDKIYGVPTNRDYAAGTDAYMLRKDILDKYGIKAEDIKTIEDLEQVFEIVKSKETNMTVLASGGGTMLTNMYFSDLMSGVFRVGVHMDYGREEKIRNLFTTEEYMSALKRVRNWYLKGYLDKDTLGETEELFARVQKGKLFAYTTKGRPSLEIKESVTAGQEMVCVQLGENAISYNMIPTYLYAISSNTVSIEKSMELLNLLYTDSTLMNLLCYGKENVHYKKMEDGHVTYIDGSRTNPFVHNAWQMPNQFISYVWEGNPLTLWEDIRRFNEEAIHCCDLGFNFDISPVATEYFNLEKIYASYKTVLENGLVNPEEGVRMMLQEMKENGVDDVIQEEEKQYIKWKQKNIKVY